MLRYNCRRGITLFVPVEATVDGHEIGSNYIGVQYSHGFHQRKRRTKLSPKLKQLIQEYVLLGARQIYPIFLNRIGEFPDEESVNQSQVSVVLFISNAP
jgi:hypothetical protein